MPFSGVRRSRRSLLELMDLFPLAPSLPFNPLESFDLFVYQLIFYHLNGVMDLHSKCCAMALLCMWRGPAPTPAPRAPLALKSPELLKLQWKILVPAQTYSMSCLVGPGLTSLFSTVVRRWFGWMLRGRAAFHTSDGCCSFRENNACATGDYRHFIHLSGIQDAT